MEIIRRKTDYGLRALMALARADRPLRAEELAEREQAPIAFLHKALTDLTNAGILDAQRGPAGGFTLAHSPREITVLAAIEAMQGPVAVSHCVLGDDACPRQESCGLRRAWEKVQQNVARFLRNLTVHDLAEAVGPASAGRGSRAASAPSAGALAGNPRHGRKVRNGNQDGETNHPH